MAELIPMLLEIHSKCKAEIALSQQDIFEALLQVDSLAAAQLAAKGNIFADIDQQTLKDMCMRIKDQPLIGLLFENNHYELKRILSTSNTLPPFQLLVNILKVRSVHEQVEIVECLLQSNDLDKVFQFSKM